MLTAITRLRKIRRSYILGVVHEGDTETTRAASFPSRRWLSASILLGLPTTRLGTKLALRLAWGIPVKVVKPAKAPRPSAVREAHHAGMDAMWRPPSRRAMALAVLALLVAVGWRIWTAVETPAPKPARTNPASLVHQGRWVGPMEGCHGTGVYTNHTGRCVVVTATR